MTTTSVNEQKWPAFSRPVAMVPRLIVGNGCEIVRRRRSAARGWIVGAGVSAALTAAAVAPAVAQAASGRLLMVCLNERTGSSNLFRSAPRRCGVHFANRPFDGDNIAPLAAIHWSGWGRPVARGHGTFHGNMDYTAPSTIVVSRPRRCSNGTRHYTWASVTTRGIGKFSGPLAACRR